MTVHGAKGLQAPLVVLPDTTALPPDDGAGAMGRAGDDRGAAVVAAQGAALRRDRPVARRGRHAAGRRSTTACSTSP